MARALWVVGKEQSELLQVELGAPGADEVLVKTLFSGVSRGTESLVYRGGVPPSVAAFMRGPNMEGEFPWPVKYGYLAVGELMSGANVGAKVFCLHPHQDQFVVKASEVVLLPEGLPPKRAVLAANMETALNAIWDAHPGPGDRVAVVGGGVVGCLVAYLLGRMPAVEVVLVDPLQQREPVAKALGVRWVSPKNVPTEMDLVIHASATAAGLRTCLESAGNEATIIELSWFGDRSVSLPLGESFHHKRLTLRSSQVGQIPPDRRARFDYRRRMNVALSLLSDERLDVLIDSEGTFDQLPTDLPRVFREPVLCHRVVYGGQ